MPNLYLDTATAAALEAWRAKRGMTRSAAARQLLRLGLAAETPPELLWRVPLAAVDQPESRVSTLPAGTSSLELLSVQAGPACWEMVGLSIDGVEGAWVTSIHWLPHAEAPLSAGRPVALIAHHLLSGQETTPPSLLPHRVEGGQRIRVLLTTLPSPIARRCEAMLLVRPLPLKSY